MVWWVWQAASPCVCGGVVVVVWWDECVHAYAFGPALPGWMPRRPSPLFMHTTHPPPPLLSSPILS